MFCTRLMLTVIVVAAAIGAPVAAAHATSPSNRAEPRSGATIFITDTLAPGGSASNESYRFVSDTLAPGGGASSIVYSPAATSFDWADAGIGAAVAAGSALLLLLPGRLAIVRRRKAVAV